MPPFCVVTRYLLSCWGCWCIFCRWSCRSFGPGGAIAVAAAPVAAAFAVGAGLACLIFCAWLSWRAGFTLEAWGAGFAGRAGFTFRARGALGAGAAVAALFAFGAGRALVGHGGSNASIEGGQGIFGVG